MITISLGWVVGFLFVVCFAAIFYLAYNVGKLQTRLMEMERFRNGVIAAVRDKATPPTDRQIALWWRTLKSLPPGSPKWVMYQKRLMEVGEIDAQGKAVNPEHEMAADQYAPPQNNVQANH